MCVLGEAKGATPFSALFGNPEAAPDIAIDPSDTAAILYSGGTTGLPKGVLLSHRNLVATLVFAEEALELTSEGCGDRRAAVLPRLRPPRDSQPFTASGRTVVTMTRIDFEQFLDLVERYRVTRAYVVPPIALALAEDPIVSGRDLSGLRHALSGAAPLGAELAEACERRLGCPVTEGFGMTEMSAITHLVPPFGEVCKPGSIGPPIPGVECRLVDHDTGEDVGPGQRGELWMRSAKVMQGYLNNAEATAATVDQDGWLRSGDIAVVDEEGWFTIVGRIKEIIKYKGFQVFPAELEMILIAHPGVADCAVIGVDDEEAGEVPQAFVVPESDDLDPKAVMQFVAEQVAPYKRIRAIEIVEEIPKSPSGRVLRRVLRERQPAA